MHRLRRARLRQRLVPAVVVVALLALGWANRDALHGVFATHDAGGRTAAHGVTQTSPTPRPRAGAVPAAGDTPGRPAASKTGKQSTDKGVRDRARALQSLAQRAVTRSRALASFSEFTYATFNALGNSHTTAHGDRARMAPGSVRGRWAAQILLGHHVDVGSLQELQRPQARAFNSVAGGTYTLWPGTVRSAREGENSVFWRTDRFALVKAEQRVYPYFHGNLRPYPWVLLRDKRNGVQFWVTSQHNPAFHQNTGAKHRAVAREVADTNALLGTRGHAPLILAGDMNDHGGFFCAYAGGTAMHAANGGSADHGCQMPPVQPRPYGFDWIMGSPGVQFSKFTWDHGSLASRTSDHPAVFTQVKLWRTDRVPRG